MIKSAVIQRSYPLGHGAGLKKKIGGGGWGRVGVGGGVRVDVNVEVKFL